MVDPSSGKSLKIDWEKNKITALDDKHYASRIEEAIPIILPRRESAGMHATALHQKADSVFSYIDHYQKDAEFFDYFRPYENSIVRDELLRLHQSIMHQIPRDATTVLDVGCGRAWLSQQQVSENRRVISLDISLTNCIKALQQTPHRNHEALVADVFHLPLAAESLDCIVASEIIEHVQAPNLFIESLLRPLKKGGKLIITTPYNEKLVYHLCVHCNRPTPANAHIHSFHEHNIHAIVPATINKMELHRFSNRLMIRFRLSYLMHRFPFRVWKVMDQIANGLCNKPSRLMMVLEK